MGLRDWLPWVGGRGDDSPEGVSELFDDDFQRKLDYLALVSRRVFAGQMRAERRTKKTGAGVEFADHREYSSGDDLRYLDWHAYGRLDRLLLRLFEEQEDLSIYFLLDTSASMGFGHGAKLDYARRVCAALAYVGLSNLDRVSIVTGSDELGAELEPTRNKKRIFRILRFLRGVEPDGETNLEQVARRFVARHKRRGLVVVLSDLYDPKGFEAGLNVLRYHKFEPLVIHVVNPADAQPALRGDLRLVDCETGVEREVTVDDAMLARFAQAHRDFVHAARRFCKRRQIPYVEASVTVPFEDLVLTVFRRGGFLR